MNEYAKKYPKLKESLVISRTVINSFKIFISNHKIEFTEAEFKKVLDMIKYRLKVEFAGYLYGTTARYEYALPDDPQFNSALDLLQKSKSVEDLFENLKTE